MVSMKISPKNVAIHFGIVIFFFALFCLCVLCFPSSRRCCSVRQSESFEEMASHHWISMSTQAELSTDAPPNQASVFSSIAQNAFNEVSQTFSVFNENSLLSDLNRNGFISLPILSPEDEKTSLNPLSVISCALIIAQKSNGAFDPTIEPLMALWGFRKTTRMATAPSNDVIQKTLNLVGYHHIVITTNANLSTATVSFDSPNIQLDLGGIAKGYAVDLAYERLLQAGATNFLLNLGGNIRVHGRPSRSRRHWRVAIRDPENPNQTTGEILTLSSGQAVATSGSYERFVIINGKHYSHIIDPRTGFPTKRSDSVSVIAPTAMEADALSTANFVLGNH